MIVIKRKRNTGKTTILLHYMVVNSNSFYVARTEDSAKRAWEFSQTLELHLDRSRFVGVSNVDPTWRQCGYKVLVDDADCIIKLNSKLSYELMAMADVITVSVGGAE